MRAVIGTRTFYFYEKNIASTTHSETGSRLVNIFRICSVIPDITPYIQTKKCYVFVVYSTVIVCSISIDKIHIQTCKQVKEDPLLVFIKFLIHL